MNKQKSILFIHPFFPYPLISGGHQALYNGLLAVHNNFKCYLTFQAEECLEYQQAKESFCKSLPNVYLLPKIYFRKKEGVFSVQKFLRKVYYFLFFRKNNNNNESLHINDAINWWRKSISPLEREWLEHVQKLIENYHFDIIQVEMPWMVSQVLSLPRDTKKIFVHHELGFVRRELQIKGLPFSPYIMAEKEFADLNEIALLNRYDMVVTLSSQDKRKLEEYGVQVPVRSSFSIVQKELSQSEPIIGYREKLSFIGPESNEPNKIGIKWFLKNCWHDLKMKDPNFSLVILGLWSKNTIDEIQKEFSGVHFLGFVDEPYEIIKDTIMIVPITIGSGIRMKILEAAQNRIPFVSTSVGAEGIPVINGEHCLIANDAEEFVRAIIKLQDTELQQSVIRNSYSMIKNIYNIVSLRDNRILIYDELLKTSSQE